MAFFSQGNLEPGRDKIRICTKCYESLYFDSDKGFCCPKCGRCWLPQAAKEEKTYTHPAAVYRGGAIVYKGESKGRKRKKPPRKNQWAGSYGEG